MSKQLHKNFTDGQAKSFLKSYLDKEIKINYILQMLKIKRRRFFELLAKYRKDPDNFSIQYKRNTSNYRIDREIEANIIQELKIEKGLIE
jgi:hypothetical protein